MATGDHLVGAFETGSGGLMTRQSVDRGSKSGANDTPQRFGVLRPTDVLARQRFTLLAVPACSAPFRRSRPHDAAMTALADLGAPHLESAREADSAL